EETSAWDLAPGRGADVGAWRGVGAGAAAWGLKPAWPDSRSTTAAPAIAASAKPSTAATPTALERRRGSASAWSRTSTLDLSIPDRSDGAADGGALAAAIGRPQPGQVGAMSDTSRAQSGHLIRATGVTILRNAALRAEGPQASSAASARTIATTSSTSS